MLSQVVNLKHLAPVWAENDFNRGVTVNLSVCESLLDSPSPLNLLKWAKGDSNDSGSHVRYMPVTEAGY